MDPIVAPATALVPQPVGILRISGTDFWPLIRNLFPDLPDTLEHRKIYHSSPLFRGVPLDECLILYFMAPHSFTGEDVLEIQAHGNPHNIRSFLDLFHKHGIRLARPGEFSLRAYQNRKISLLKAESLHRMIQAPSFSQFHSSYQQFSNPVLHPLFSFQQDYLDLLARLFMILDHPESEEAETDVLSRNSFLVFFDNLVVQAKSLMSDYRKNRRRFQGFTVLIAGYPNSGKSSLFNRLLKDNRAIVSSTPGTTRDLVEGRLSFSSGDVILLDSAGLRLTSEKIEQEGIKKTRQMLGKSDCILWISSPDYPELSPELHKHRKNTGTRVLHLWNKSDLSLPGSSSPHYDHLVSARTRKGLLPLVRRLESLANDFYSKDSPCEKGALDSDRQFELLTQLLRLIKPVPDLLYNEQFDLALSTLEEGRRVLDDGVGMVPSSDIYDRVFRMFCLGK